MVKTTPRVAAIGNFDGVHRGHRHLVEETIAFAATHNAEAAAVTFDPHPRRYFHPDEPPFLITSLDMRTDLIKAAGAKEVFVLNFDSDLVARTPEEFLIGILKERLGLAGVVVGADFRFGKGRAGGIEALQSIGEAAGLWIRIAEVIAEEPFAEKFSSSSVREAISDGNMKTAERLLGRRWAVRGKIMEGQKLGRSLGFATANMTLGDLVEPRRGVYATRVLVDGKSYGAVCNFGRRPTVDDGAPLLEAHLFDFDGDLYSRQIEVEFVDFIRDEQKFDGLDALKAQIAADCETARQMLSAG